MHRSGQLWIVQLVESTKGAVKGAVPAGAKIGKLAAQAVRQILAGVAKGMDEIAKAKSSSCSVVRTGAKKQAAAARHPIA